MRAPHLLGSLALTALVALPQASAQSLDPAVEGELELSLVVSGLGPVTAAEHLPDGRLLAIDQFGSVRLWDGPGHEPRVVGAIGVRTGFDAGLLGFALDPEFESNRRVYFYYSVPDGNELAWTTFDPESGRVDTGDLRVVLGGVGFARDHNGGGVAFGPDGLLYLAVGDSACNCDCAPGTNTSNYFSTCLTNLSGKILRVDREGNAPSSNPLVNVAEVAACGTREGCAGPATLPAPGGTPRPEIYNWGLRNPWRFTFDPATGYLWIADVGERAWEEITISTGPAQHHGWPFREGAHGQPVTACAEVTPLSGDCRDPAFEYRRDEQPNTENASISGGTFSSHCRWPERWRGRYWFGDYAKARVWTLTPNEARDGVVGEREIIVRGARGPVHFFGGPDGAVYFTTIEDGSAWRLAPRNPAPCGEEPDGGVSAPDASDDAGAAPDGGSAPGSDAGHPRDAAMVDAGEPPARESGGCGCRSPDGAPSWGALGLLALLVTARLRRR